MIIFSDVLSQRRFVQGALFDDELAGAAARDNMKAWIARTWSGLSESLNDGIPSDSRVPPRTIASN